MILPLALFVHTFPFMFPIQANLTRIHFPNWLLALLPLYLCPYQSHFPISMCTNPSSSSSQLPYPLPSPGVIVPCNGCQSSSFMMHPCSVSPIWITDIFSSPFPPPHWFTLNYGQVCLLASFGCATLFLKIHYALTLSSTSNPTSLPKS